MTLIGLSPGIEELLLSAIVIFLITLIYRFLVNQKEMREIKEKQKEYQSKMKDLQKNNPEESKRAMAEMLALSNKQLRMSMKPMFISLIIFVAIVIPILPGLFPGNVVNLPFSLPYFGQSLEWFWWYVIVSFPLNSIFRKFLGVEI
ncbi:hypothetical protein A3K64_00585 [Candidatus Micrarchaeota archaeon RBG_16_36_9]|nr:MAG: hypothetical protein A3K64_00585 [Candidatus Micrarchaeota archaeon RBG_16_36_9]